MGERLPHSPTATFHARQRLRAQIVLRVALLPLIRLIERLTEEIKLYDEVILAEAEKEYPAVKDRRSLALRKPAIASCDALWCNQPLHTETLWEDCALRRWGLVHRTSRRQQCKEAGHCRRGSKARHSDASFVD